MAYRTSNSDQFLELLTGSVAGTVTTSTVAASASSVQIVAAGARKSLSIFNGADTDLYIVYGDGPATTSAFSIKLVPGALYESPLGGASFVLHGIWAGSPTGNAQITEVS